MDANELRALADALEPMAKAPRFEDFDVPAFCAWMRACADAQPVAWRCEVRGDGTDPKLGAGDWRHYRTTTGKREAQAFVARCGDGIEGRAVPLYPHAAAPQAEPKREPNPDEVICPACTHQFRAIPENVQAQLWEKREPLSDRQLASVCMSYRHDFGLLDDAEQVRLLLEARAWERAFRKEWQRC